MAVSLEPPPVGASFGTPRAELSLVHSELLLVGFDLSSRPPNFGLIFVDILRGSWLRLGGILLRAHRRSGHQSCRQEYKNQ